MSIYAEHQRKQRIKATWNGFLWFGRYVMPWVVGAIILVVSAWGVRGLFRQNDNDYAGYGPGNVTKHDFHAIGSWVGYNAKEISRKKSRYATNSAWATQYRLGDKTICVYVWGGSGSPEQSAVVEGICK